MANSDKNIVITPNRSSSTDQPKIAFTGQGNSTVTLRVLDDANNTLSFEGNVGQLFSISNSLTGNIFSVNDISGIPSVRVNSDGNVFLAELGGNVGVGNVAPTHKLSVTGTMNVSGNANVGNLGTAALVMTGALSGVTTLSVTGNANVGNIGATRGVFTNISGTLETAAQTNITSVGTLTSLAVTGNITSGNVSGTRGAFTNISGTLETAAQTNITSVGTLGTLTVSGNAAFDTNTLFVDSVANEVGIGTTSPSERLEVVGNLYVNGEGSGLIIDSGGAKRVGLMKYGGQEGLISRIAAQDFGIVRTGGSNIFDGSSLTFDLYVDGNGNIGIGNTAPTHKLSVTGTANISGNLTAANLITGNLTLGSDALTSSHHTITLDPSTAGAGGNVIIQGNLQVTGTTTTVNSTTVEVTDLNLTLAKDAVNAAAANGAGLTVAGASATMTYASTGDKWTFNKPLDVTGSLTASTTLNVTGNANVGNLGAAAGVFSGTLSVTGNSTQGNITTGNTITYGQFGTPIKLRVLTDNSLSFEGSSGQLFTINDSLTGDIFNVNDITGLPSIRVNSNGNVFLAEYNGNVGIGNVAPAHKLSVTGTMNVSGNANVGNLGAAAGVFSGNITAGNINSVSGILSVTGNANVGNIGATRGVFTNIAGTLETASQTNITSVGTLGALSVTGNANVGNIGATRGVFTNISGTLETAAQTNITSLGTLTSLTVSGNATFDTNTLFVDSVNNEVGIGTTSPLAILNTNAGTITGPAVTPGLMLTSLYSGVTAVNSIDWNYSGQSTSPVRLGATFNSGGAGMEMVFYTSTSYTTTGSERMRINMDGNVGVGNSAPAHTLRVEGTLSATGNANVGNLGTSGNITANYFFGNGSQLTGITAAPSPTVANGTSNLVVTANGNVTTSVAGTANVLVVTSTGANVAGTLNVTGASYLATSSGNVGIGTSSPGRLLDVRGLSAFSDGTQGFILGPYTGGSGYGAIYNFGTTPGAANYVFASSTSETVLNNATRLVFAIGAIEKMRMDSSGNVGIGNASPTHTLSVTGTLNVSGNANVGNIGATNGVFTNVSGSGAAMTSLPAGNLTGTIPSGVLGNSSLFVGTTSIALNRSSANLALTGITSIAMPGSTSGTVTLQPAATAGTTTITLPATTGTVVTTGDSGTVTSTMIADATIVNADISASAAIAYSKLSLTGSIVNADISASAAIAVSKLAASTISGITLGNNLNTLTLNTSGTGLSGSTTYNGSAAATFTVTSNATSANTASAIVARDASGNFSAGTITATFSGSGAALTSLPAGNLTGTIPSGVLGNSSHFIGTTSIALNRASANQSLSGITSLVMPGSTSGNVTLQPAATAGTTTITLPATTGTVVTTGDSGTVTSTMIADGTIVNGDISASAAIAVSKLAASTISGVTLGNNLNTLTLNTSGTGLSGSTTYNGSAAATFTVTSNATSANTGSAIVARDVNGDFNARYINVSYFNSTDDISTGTLTYLMGKFGDNYFRSATAAKVATFISGQTMNISGTATNITAYTINQSVGTGNAPTFAGLTATGRIIAQSSQASVIANATASLGGLECYGGGSTNAAFMTFHRPGAYAVYFGLDGTDLKVGGWSMGAVSYVMLNENNWTSYTSGKNVQLNSLGVGTAGSGTAGEIRATNNITAYYSDQRLKENIRLITNPLEKVSKISGVTFTQNSLAETFGYTDYSQQVGVIAQEIQAVLPEAVTAAPFDIAEDGTSKSGENYLTVRYEKLVPLLIEAIKELSAKVKELENK